MLAPFFIDTPMSTPTSVTEEAERLRVAGRIPEAMTLLESATGDPSALYMLALWCLAGVAGQRELRRARALFRSAQALGNIDAALAEIALTANGTGAPADWQSAFRQLETAAKTIAGAREQLDILYAMHLEPNGSSPHHAKPSSLAAAPRVDVYPRLLTRAECDYLIRVGDPLMRPAIVVDPASGRSVAHPIRTSDVGVIGPLQENLVIRAINQRLADITATEIGQGEPLNILRYRPGQQYRLHLDALPPGGPQRTKTAIIYLNSDYLGGETHFPDLDIRVRGNPGDVVVFDNITRQGGPDPRTRHAGLPVQQGTKWIATRWIRTAVFDPWTMR